MIFSIPGYHCRKRMLPPSFSKFCNVIIFFTALLLLMDLSSGNYSIHIDRLDQIGFYYGISSETMDNYSEERRSLTRASHSKEEEEGSEQQEYYERIAQDVELWSREMLDNNDDGWKEVECAFKRKFNPNDETKQWVKWMKDSRRDGNTNNNNEQNKLHPCMKLRTTINAPYHLVCRYLSQEDRYREYNSLLVDQKDLEVITPHSKICWSQTKKIMFIQPRDFVTFCHHKWLTRKGGRDDDEYDDTTQLVVSQACDHETMMMSADEDNERLRAFALRGATYISKHSDTKTSIVMLAHCNCGRDIPEWAVRAAVKVSAPIKPFEIIHRINVGIAKSLRELEEEEESSSRRNNKKEQQQQLGGSSSSSSRSRSARPAGIAQMGYACFWPDGGGTHVEED